MVLVRWSGFQMLGPASRAPGRDGVVWTAAGPDHLGPVTSWRRDAGTTDRRRRAAAGPGRGPEPANAPPGRNRFPLRETGKSPTK